MNKYQLYALGGALLAASSLASCAGTATKVDNVLGSAKTQEDVKWSCLTLQGGLTIYQAASGDNSALVTNTRDALNTTCQRARTGQLTNAEEAYALVMDLAGQLAAGD